MPTRTECRPVYFAVSTVLIGLAPVAAAAPPTLEERIARLEERLEAARVEQHIPGMSIAVVREDEIIFARGFGLADLENEVAATPETIYAVGSTTKAFTANLIGMLVDEGKMSWDAHLSSYLPYFQLKVDSDDEGDAITVRDSLCHRSGFTRMSLLFIGGTVPRHEIIETANGAEPFSPFRKQFHYNNVMFMAAGMAAGEAAGSSWEELIRTRIFAPLGMDDSSVTYDEAQQDDRLALGYSWDTDKEEWDHAPMRNIDIIGPAGSINSSVLDMAKWVRLQLGRGIYEGKRLISEDSHAETWSPQITIASGIDYGFGWMLREWDGKNVVEHGGNIDGFAAEVGLLPDENLGFVLLMNTGFAPLQQTSINIVFDAIAGDWEVKSESERRDTAAADDLAKYEGVYIANYAQFDDEKFTVAVNENGQLTVDIPSQTTFILEAAGDDGRMPFAGVPQIKATFDLGEDGEAEMLRLYQGGLQFEIPREGHEDPIEVPLEELDKYLGTYHFKQMNADVEVKIKNNRLAADIPGQMAFEFHPPDEDGKWQGRNNDVIKLALSFEEDEYGNVEAMNFHQGAQQFELERIAAASTADLPSLEDVFTLCGLDERQKALEAAGVIRTLGSVRFAQSGIDGTMTLIHDSDDRMRSDIELGRFGFIRSAVDVDRGWIHLSFSEFEELHGDFLRRVKYEHPATYLGDWRTFYDEIRVDGAGTVGERDVLIIKVRIGDDPAHKYHIDAETGDILKVDAQIPIPGFEGVSMPVTSLFEEWRLVDGVRMPFRFVVETQDNGRMVATIESVETGVDVGEDAFTLTGE